MTESTEDQLQSEPGGSPAQASQKVQTKPVGAAGIGTPAAAVAVARSGIRQSPCTASPTQRPQIQIVAVIPVYDQPAKLESVVQSLRQLALPVIVVDDGSHEPTKSLCDRLAAPQVKVIHQPFNQGKGAAVIVGFKAAVRMGFTHVLQIDADGQLDFVGETSEYARRARLTKEIFQRHGFRIVYDKDQDETVSDGFFYTVGYGGLSSAELLSELLLYGICAISLTSTGSRQPGIRVCVSQLNRPEQFDLLEARLTAFGQNHR